MITLIFRAFPLTIEYREQLDRFYLSDIPVMLGHSIPNFIQIIQTNFALQYEVGYLIFFSRSYNINTAFHKFFLIWFLFVVLLIQQLSKDNIRKKEWL